MRSKMMGRIIACMAATVMMVCVAGCGEAGNESAESATVTIKEASSAKEQIGVGEVDSQSAKKIYGGAEVLSDAEAKQPDGVYAREYTEEFDGTEFTREFSYEFRADGTGVATIQDDVPFTWNEKEIIINDTAFEYVLEGEMLKIKENDVWTEYHLK